MTSIIEQLFDTSPPARMVYRKATGMIEISP